MESGEDFSISKRHGRSLMGSFSKRKVSHLVLLVCTKCYILGWVFSLHTGVESSIVIALSGEACYQTVH